MRIEDKLAILADAAKYDVSCASSGSGRGNAGRGLGNTAPGGVCHSYTEDGRCVSLLKILYSNACIYDCAYCVNRVSNDVQRASFTSSEIVRLTMDFYRRNYIEGLFLSSGILRSPDDTMERLVRTAEDLRRQGFNGYIHLKCVPYADSRLIQRAGRLADRLSVNIELPSEKSLRRLTREKSYASILDPMGTIRDGISESREDRKRMRHAPRFAPAGQSTQLIVGASPESDYDILHLADSLYQKQALKRVYYSAYLPVTQPDRGLPDITEAPLVRENRLYQSDWLIRLYGFSIDEVIDADSPYLDLGIDPKQAFAYRHPELFPVDINTADREMILRVPGIGIQSANRIVNLRRMGRIRWEHLKQMGVALGRARPFIRRDGLPAAHRTVCGTARSPGSIEMPCTSARDFGLPHPASRLVWVTDGTFEGLLTAIFAAYRTKRKPDAIEPGGIGQLSLFEDRIDIQTDFDKADRTWRGLKRYLGSKKRRQLFEAHLSGSPGVETMIFQIVSDMVPDNKNRLESRQSAGPSSHLQVEKLARKVRQEAHRMKGFVRFQQTGKERYLALIAPQYDILPLVRKHFEARFADQQWIIYDTARNYGICHDTRDTRELRLDSAALKAFPGDAAPNEEICQCLWRRYYDAVNIPQRSNPKLHARMLPRRYWRYLPEKQQH